MNALNPMDGYCRARNRSGARCRRRAILGGTVCYMHGGAAPQVQRAAAERLKALVDPAIDRLEQLLMQTEFPTVAIAAVKDILDRTLGRALESVTITHDVNLKQILNDARLRAARRNTPTDDV